MKSISWADNGARIGDVIGSRGSGNVCEEKLESG